MGNQSCLWTQDMALAHMDQTTQLWLSSRNISFAAANEWPLSTPTCNHLNFFLWSQLETLACAPTKNVDELKHKFCETWALIPTEDVRQSCLMAEQRFKACIKAMGDHFEIYTVGLIRNFFVNHFASFDIDTFYIGWMTQKNSCLNNLYAPGRQSSRYIKTELQADESRK